MGITNHFVDQMNRLMMKAKTSEISYAPTKSRQPCP